MAAGALLVFTDAGSRPLALVMFTLAAFALAALVQEFARGAAAYRSLAGGSYAQALLALFARNRRRYGGYVVHAGVAVLLIAVAASSSFQTSRDLRLRPGQSATVDDYRITYDKPTAEISPVEQRLTFGSILTVTKDGKPYATLAPSRNYYASAATEAGAGPVRSFFEGQATSEVGRRTTASNDLWTAMQPDLTSLNPLINGADRRLEKLAKGVAPTNVQAGQALGYLQGLAVRTIERRYLTDTPPADFRVNVNPLVSWIWIGGAIAAIGGLSRSGRRRRPGAGAFPTSMRRAWPATGSRLGRTRLLLPCWGRAREAGRFRPRAPRRAAAIRATGAGTSSNRPGASSSRAAARRG